MDDSKEFIKMSGKAREILEDWKPRDGDFVWHPDEGVEAFGCREFPEEFGIVIISDSQTEDWWRNWLWLPSQSRLQEIISKLYGNCHWYDILEPFINWYQTEEHSVDSMEQLWLAFVMKEKYSKVWNGEDWIKEEDKK